MYRVGRIGVGVEDNGSTGTEGSGACGRYRNGGKVVNGHGDCIGRSNATVASDVYGVSTGGNSCVIGCCCADNVNVVPFPLVSPSGASVSTQDSTTALANGRITGNGRNRQFADGDGNAVGGSTTTVGVGDG